MKTENPRYTPEQTEPPISHIDINTFPENPLLGTDTPFIIQLKGFNREERNARRSAEILGNPARKRTVSKGAIFGFSDLNPNDTITQENAVFSTFLDDSRGLTMGENGHLYAGSINKIIDFDLNSSKRCDIYNPWFAFIHSLDTSPQGNLLVASSGFDRIMELDVQTKTTKREWVAWNHGYSIAFQSRKTIKASTIKPTDYPEGLGLPKEDRSAFPNGLIYLDRDTIAATLYYGGLITINLTTGKTDEVNTHLSHPHAIKRLKQGYMVSNTGKGEVQLLDENFQVRTILDFTHIAKPNDDKCEWLQFATPVGTNNQFVAVDSCRAALVFIDIDRKEKRIVKYDPNWVVQEVMPISNTTLSSLMKIR